MVNTDVLRIKRPSVEFVDQFQCFVLNFADLVVQPVRNVDLVVRLELFLMYVMLLILE